MDSRDSILPRIASPRTPARADTANTADTGSWRANTGNLGDRRLRSDRRTITAALGHRHRLTIPTGDRLHSGDALRPTPGHSIADRLKFNRRPTPDPATHPARIPAPFRR